MARKKGQGSTKNGRDSNPQYLGIKLYGGEVAQPGSIIVRQRGTPLFARLSRGARSRRHSLLSRARQGRVSGAQGEH